MGRKVVAGPEDLEFCGDPERAPALFGGGLAGRGFRWCWASGPDFCASEEAVFEFSKHDSTLVLGGIDAACIIQRLIAKLSPRLRKLRFFRISSAEDTLQVEITIF